MKQLKPKRQPKRFHVSASVAAKNQPPVIGVSFTFGPVLEWLCFAAAAASAYLGAVHYLHVQF